MNSVVLAVLLMAAAPSFEVQTLDGRTVVGRLVELTTDRVQIDAADGRVTLDIEQVVSISLQQKPTAARRPPGVVVELTDGSIIRGRQYVANGTRASITLAGGDVIEASADAIRTVALQPRLADLAEQWERLIHMKVDADLLVIRKDQALDYHRGVLHDVTDDAVRFDLDGEILPVKRSKVYGLAYHRLPRDLPAAACRITDAAGSQWSARSVSLGERLQWTTPTGLVVSQPVDQIVQIDFSRGKIVYLSDLKPEKVRWTPYFGLAKPLATMAQAYAPQTDRSFEGRPLRLGEEQYPKGLAIRGRTEIVYRLPDRFSRFRAIAGIDDAVRPAGKVRLLVRGDERDLFDAIVSGGDAPRPIDLDLTGVRRLTILVDFADGLTAGDYLLLGNARLTK